MIIQEMRKQNRLTQDALAKRIGVSRAAISQFESGDSKPSVDTLSKLAQVFDVDMQVLLTGKLAPFDVHFQGPLADQPHVDLPFPDFKTLAHFGQHSGLSLQSLANCNTLRVYLRPGELPSRYEGAMVIEIWGDSMEPELHNGERMIVWQVSEGKWESLHNTACVVAYDDTVTIKAIIENDLFVHDRLTLRAANRDSGYFVVPRNSIHSIWEVREYYDRPKYSLSLNRR